MCAAIEMWLFLCIDDALHELCGCTLSRSLR